MSPVDGYTAQNIFIQIMTRYGLAVAILGLTFFVCLVLAAYYMKTRIDLGRQEQASREAERAALVQELSATRAQVNTFLTNHLEHLRLESDKFGKALTDVSKAMQEVGLFAKVISDEIKAHRAEEAERAAKMYEKIDDVRLRIAEGG